MFPVLTWDQKGTFGRNGLKVLYLLREKCPNTEFFLVGIFPHSEKYSVCKFHAVFL